MRSSTRSMLSHWLRRHQQVSGPLTANGSTALSLTPQQQLNAILGLRIMLTASCSEVRKAISSPGIGQDLLST